MRALLLCSVWRLSSPLRISRTPSPSSGPAWRLHPVTPDMVALDKILDLWCNNQRLPTFHTRLTLGSTLHDSGVACQLAQRCRTLMARPFNTLAAMHRAASPTIPTKIHPTVLDLRLAARLGVRRCKRDAHDSHCAHSACDSSGSLDDWLLDTRGRDDPDTHSLSLPTSGSLHVRLPSMATAWSAGGQDKWFAWPSDCLARQRRGPSWSAFPGDSASLARNTTLLIP
jgi:hypothetical protein